MLDLEALVDANLLACPHCGTPVLREDGGWRCVGATCRYAHDGFPVVGGQPAFVDFDHSVLDAATLRDEQGASAVARSPLAGTLRRLVHPVNTTAHRQVSRMVELLRADRPGENPRVLVIGGGTVGDGLEELYDDPTVDVISFDVYASASTQFVADGHGIPLASGSIDGVVVQAVLEHVLEPTVVAREIHRVLRRGGMVYADTPFLQQVHEGPYDFTRFTESGHRYLFRGFELVDSGPVAGAGTALRWSIDHYVRALTRSVLVGRLVALLYFWLSWTDRVLDRGHSSDSASSVFFLGRKVDQDISPADAVDFYRGGM